MAEYKGILDSSILIPLAAKIYVTKYFPAYFLDPYALMLETKIPYESIIQKVSQFTLLSCVARYHSIDRIVRDFISQHDECNIVNIGCGLESMSRRIPLPDFVDVNYYEVDLPNVIRRRKDIMGDSKSEMTIACDLFDLTWTDNLNDRTPTLIVASDVFQDYTKDEIISFISNVSWCFYYGELVFDTLDTRNWTGREGKENPFLKSVMKDPFLFARSCGATLLSSSGLFYDMEQMLGDYLSLQTKAAIKLAKAKKASLLHLKF